MTDSGCFGVHPVAVICTYLQLMGVQLPWSLVMNPPRAIETEAPAGAVLVGSTVVEESAVTTGRVVSTTVAVGCVVVPVDPVGDAVDEVIPDPPVASVLGCVGWLLAALVQPTSRAAPSSAADARRGVVRMAAVCHVPRGWAAQWNCQHDIVVLITRWLKIECAASAPAAPTTTISGSRCSSRPCALRACGASVQCTSDSQR